MVLASVFLRTLSFIEPHIRIVCVCVCVSMLPSGCTVVARCGEMWLRLLRVSGPVYWIRGRHWQHCLMHVLANAYLHRDACFAAPPGGWGATRVRPDRCAHSICACVCVYTTCYGGDSDDGAADDDDDANDVVDAAVDDDVDEKT